jgi:regulation of enolase protein 1 (concanavalin A-like superfamily)
MRGVLKMLPEMLLIIPVLLTGCSQQTPKPDGDISGSMSLGQVSGMQWSTSPEQYQISDSSLLVTVAGGTDYFNNPEDGSVTGSAPFLYQEVRGDFVARALVEPDFSSQWNAAALMVHLDSLNWIKFAFENSDATGPGIVSVVTRGTSDDANGVVLKDTRSIWLALVRKEDNYAMHWSRDGKEYRMARLARMPHAEKVKVGVEAQSPVGATATHRIHYFEVEERTVDNLRNLNQ